ncbi:MAG: RdgB/HAM1 family non-canonical purine NTP pyrophosphatase [Pseudomonadales bacterium]
MKIILASNNQKKLQELRDCLNSDIELVTAADFNIESPEETGTTFVENAIIKARHAAQISGLAAIADDSGLEVDALNGAPGIYSARYAGANATDADNNTKLLTALAGNKQRTARFRCVIVFMRHALDPMPVIASGSWEGEILTAPMGEDGFGYDPIFSPNDIEGSVALLDRAQKSALSHRGQALRRFNQLFQG